MLPGLIFVGPNRWGDSSPEEAPSRLSPSGRMGPKISSPETAKEVSPTGPFFPLTMMKHLTLLFLCLLAAGVGKAQDVKIVSLPSNDLIYVPGEDRIYAATPGGGENGNSLCVINPYFGTLEQCYFVGSEPRTLAISDDGAYIYVGLAGAPLVVRFNVATKEVDQTFGLGTHPAGGPNYAREIEVLPGNPDVIAVARYSITAYPFSRGVAVFDNGQPRDLTTPDTANSNSLAFAGPTDQLYGLDSDNYSYNLYPLLLSANGVTNGPAYTGLIDGSFATIEGQGDFLYSSTGRKISVAGPSPLLVGTYTLGNYFRSGVYPAPDSNVVYFVTTYGSVYDLQTFNKTTFNKTGTVSITDPTGNSDSAIKLIGWGGGGKLAFRTDQSVVLVRNCTSLAATPVLTAPATGCYGSELVLTAPAGYGSYSWSNGAVGQSIILTQYAELSVRVSDSLGCLSQPSNTVAVSFDYPNNYAPDIISVNERTVICQGGSITLEAYGGSYSLLWSTGATTPTIEVTEGGEYTVASVSQGGCLSPYSAPFVITESDEPQPEQPVIDVMGSTMLCPNEVVELSAPPGFAAYEWSNGQQTPSIIVSYESNFQVRVSTEGGCVSEWSEPVQVWITYVNQPIIYSFDGLLYAENNGGLNEWFLNGVLIASDSSSSYVPMETGVYTVRTIFNGCTSPFSPPSFFTFTSVEETVAAGGIAVYPNPVSQILRIGYDAARVGAATLLVTDLSGREISRMPLTDRVDLSRLAGGVYVVRVLGEDRRVLFTERVVKL